MRLFNLFKTKNMKKHWTKKCTCENFQQNEDCEHIGDSVLKKVRLIDIGIKDGCGQPVLMEEVGMQVEDSILKKES
jgi:hypothetical protein